MRFRAMAPSLVAAALLLCAACSGDGDDDSTVRSQTPAGSDASVATTPADDEQETDSDGDGGDTSDESLGTGTGQAHADGSGTPLVPLRVEVTSLQRHGELVELSMSLTNEHENAEFTPGEVFTDPETESASRSVDDLSGVRLIDQGERRAYLPVLDSEGLCMCSFDLDEITIGAGEAYQLQASFGGIPDNVTTLDLEVPGFSMIAGLEVGA